ncbi:AAA family ATPase [Arhodomonas sp. AD133]|uniref:AAA family ATPase n=1 Tax=Arhodomonas sp. AD133 TaxID=3415009 RepID=UPI003EC07D73
MRYRLNVLLAGRDPEELAHLESLLRCNSGVALLVRHLLNGHADPLRERAELPDALVYIASSNWEAELGAYMERPASARPPLLVVGPPDNMAMMRMAMRAGARDFLALPVTANDLNRVISALVDERQAASADQQGRLTAVINAKGGAGASMVASNLARLLVDPLERRVVLVDLDVQFGTLPVYFNLEPRNELVRALEVVDTLDTLALEGYVQSHESGLDLLASAPDDLMMPGDVLDERVERLLAVLGAAYDEVVVDLPRWIAGATASVLDRADRILIVLEQSVTHLRDAKRMVSILEQELSVPASRIRIVVNRFDKHNVVGLREVREALPSLEVTTLANDFRRVTESINLGSPLADTARRAALTRDLRRLSTTLGREPVPAHTHSGLRRLWPWARG